MEKKGIAVAGSILADVINMVSKYPKEGELTQICKVSRAVGGCVPNVAIDLKRLCPDLDVMAAGRISNDDNGKYVLDILCKNGVNTDNITITDDNKTSFTQVISVEGGQRTFFTFPGASADFDYDDIDFGTLCPKMLHLGYFLLLKRIDDGDGLKILKTASEKGIKTSIDLVSENSDRYKSVLPCLPFTDYLIVNELEGGRLAGIEPTPENIPQTAKELINLGVREKVIIHYREGSVCCNKSGEITFLESFNLPEGYIKGTTGAGDAFCAGSLLGIYNGLSDTEILNFGRIAAAMSLAAADATSGVIDIKESKKRCECFERK